MTNSLSNTERLKRCERELSILRRELELARPLVQWALAEIMAEQEARLELGKRLGTA